MQSVLEHELERFRRQCRAAGLSLTHQREVIFRAVLISRDHPTPEAIYEVVSREIRSISLATVYKNVKTFLEAGLLREVSPHHGSLRLEANLSEHHHLVCTGCKAIVDLDEGDIEPVQWRAAQPEGFRITRYNVEFHGLCPRCVEAQQNSSLLND